MPDKNKIHVSKDEDLAQVLERVAATEGEAVVLNIPNFSRLAKSEFNFSILKREAGHLGKRLVIETVDDSVVLMAEKHNLEAHNPFFERMEVKEDSEGGSGAPLEPPAKKEDFIEEYASSVKTPYFKQALIFALIVFLIWPAIWATNRLFGEAEVKVVTQKIPWTLEENLTVQGEIFVQKRNGEFAFPASGRETVARKARGEIVIYNNYSSSPQPLVATTRFLTPDGKIFRLVKGVTVPGSPGSIKAEVTADKAGPEYNLGPIAKLTIPGLKGSPKYNGFYGELSSGTRGGFLGEAAVPSKEDLAKAKLSTREQLASSLKTALESQLPHSYQILDGATQFDILQEEINDEIKEESRFSIFAEGEMKVVAFSEEKILDLIKGKIMDHHSRNLTFKNYELNYAVSSADFENSQLSLAVNFQGVLEPPLAAEELRVQLAGKSEEELKALIFSLEGVESLTASIKPFWRRSLPTDSNQIKIRLD